MSSSTTSSNREGLRQRSSTPVVSSPWNEKNDKTSCSRNDNPSISDHPPLDGHQEHPFYLSLDDDDRIERTMMKRPMLRCSGSSMGLSTDSSDQESTDERTTTFEMTGGTTQEFTSLLPPPTTTTATKSSKSNQHPSFTSWFALLVCHFRITAATHLTGLTQGFCQSTLPWEGPPCRSMWCGGTGLLYMMPSLVAHHPVERIIWIIQGMVSFLADYVHIHHDSIWHGMDRSYATLLVVLNVMRAIQVVATLPSSFEDYHCQHPMLLFLVMVLPPTFAFVQASQAKRKGKDVEEWKRWHGWWHVSSTFIVTFLVYLYYQTPR